MDFDTIIRHGKIVDGSGNPWQQGDIGIKSGKIATLNARADASAYAVIEARGMYVCPGFINSHSHLDMSILGDPQMRPSVLQGITTEIGGLCGQSVAPTTKDEPERLKNVYKAHWLGFEYGWDWVTMGEFLKRVKECGVSVNFGMLVGHTTLRLTSMGPQCRPAKRKELDALKLALDQAMCDGAFGMSAGLQWQPSFFCETSELIELNEVVSQHGGFYACHMRSEGDNLLEAVAEVLTIGEQAHVPVVISHLKAAGKRNFGKVNAALRMVTEARNRGIDAVVDIQPYGALDRGYVAESMSMTAGLPPWVICQAGGFENLKTLLKKKSFRQELKREINECLSNEWRTRIVDGVLKNVGWDGLVLDQTVTGKYKKYEGRSISYIAKYLARDPYDVYFDMLAEDEVPSRALYLMVHPDDLRTVVNCPFSIPEVDSVPRSRHPRKYGCFPRFLTQYVRDERLYSLEEAIRKITSFPANRLGLQDRGLIKEGFWADLAIFEWNNLEDQANFVKPERHPRGIEHVIVNGIPVVERGIHTGAAPGRVLRH